MGVFITDHPMIQHKLTVLRKKKTPPKDFRELIVEITTMMAYEATRNFPLEEIEIETPLEKTRVRGRIPSKVCIVPILRAGLSMVDGVLRLFPDAKVGHIGIYRDQDTLKPHEYFCKFPNDLYESEIFLLDPVLATGGSVCASIEFLRAKGAKDTNIRFLCLLSAPEGLDMVNADFPRVSIYTAAIDRALNEKGYIIPGLGDAGDRMFGTK